MHPTGSHRSSKHLAQAQLVCCPMTNHASPKPTNFHNFVVKEVRRRWANVARGPPFCQSPAYICPTGADKAADSSYKLNHTCTYMEQDSAPSVPRLPG